MLFSPQQQHSGYGVPGLKDLQGISMHLQRTGILKGVSRIFIGFPRISMGLLQSVSRLQLRVAAPKPRVFQSIEIKQNPCPNTTNTL